VIKELSESFAGVFRERIVSPFAGAVLIAWFYWNWQIPFLLFSSDLPIEARLAEVAQNHTSLKRNVWWPLLTAVAIVGVYPLLAYLPYRWWLITDAWKQKARVAYSDGLPLTPEQASELKREISHAQLRISSLRDESNSAISARELVIDELRQRLSEITAAKANDSGLAEEFSNIQGERLDALERARIANEQLENLRDESQREREQIGKTIERLKKERDDALVRNENHEAERSQEWDREFDEFVDKEPSFLRQFKELFTDINDEKQVTGDVAAAAVAHDLVRSSGDRFPNWRLTDKGKYFARLAFRPKAIPEEEIPF
jgi:hypothetical protein